jgi:hypothetical protein
MRRRGQNHRLTCCIQLDKVRILFGPHVGKRGVLSSVRGRGWVTVKLADGGAVVTVKADAIRNFSAAARKAWKTAPSRRVGRPAGKSVQRVSVTLRIDTSLWQRFVDLECRGLVGSRSSFIEAALTGALERLD